MKFAASLALNVFLLIIIFVFSACRKDVAENTNVMSVNADASVSKTNIEEIDFKNFTYSRPADGKSFTLIDGEKPFGKLDDSAFSLIKVDYADLTGDGRNEALINLAAHHAASDSNSIYVFTMDKGKPRTVWNFWTGNKSEGGLKSIYAQNDELIVELFGSNKFENEELDFGSMKGNSDVRPSVFTKARFKWNGERMTLEGKPEITRLQTGKLK